MGAFSSDRGPLPVEAVGCPRWSSHPRPTGQDQPRGDGAALWCSEAGGRGVLVTGTQPPDVVELWDWTMAVGDCHVSEAQTPGTKELVQVHEGGHHRRSCA
jgi:hypothetical protein